MQCSNIRAKETLNIFSGNIKLRLARFKSLFKEAATSGVLCKKVFLEILQNSQENTGTRVSFLIKLQA